MWNSTSTLATADVSTAKPQATLPGVSRGPPAGINILLIIIYGGMVALMAIVFVQRLLLRIAPKYSKGYTDMTKRAPKSLREDIDNRLMRTLHVVHDPKLLSDDDHRLQHLVTEDDDREAIYNYLYRMKAIDDIKKLEGILCKINETLKRPPLKDFTLHLRDVKSHSSGVLKNVRTIQIKALTDLYEHARYKQENFGKQEYEKFTDVLDDVISGIEHKSKKKRGARKQPSVRNTNNSHNDETTSRRISAKEDDYSEKAPLMK